MRGILGGWFTRTHHAVDFNQRIQLRFGGIDPHGVGHEGTAIQIVDEQRIDRFHACFTQASDQIIRYFIVDLCQQFASFRCHDVSGQNLAV